MVPEKIIVNYGKYMNQYDIILLEKRKILGINIWNKQRVIRGDKQQTTDCLTYFVKKYPGAVIEKVELTD